jgi:NAD(P)-dependent dehydrogenase (short-subunit alcohol dehydrogenase family)
MPSSQSRGAILLAGASRGLGLGLTAEYLSRGWQVIATARQPDRATGLQALLELHPGLLTIQKLDVADTASASALASCLVGQTLDVLFVVAGISTYSDTQAHLIDHAAVGQEFITNAIAPLAVAEAMRASLAPGATVVFMTSILGSIASNAGGGMELYRASKAALNMLASCYALRHKSHPVILMHPGWVRTELGGANAPLDVPTSARGMAEALAAYKGRPGLAYVDYQGHKLPW